MKPSLPLAPRHWISWLAVVVLTVVWLMPRVLRNAVATTAARFMLKRDNATNRAVSINLEACFPALSGDVRQAIFERYIALHLQAMMLTPRNWWGSNRSIIKSSRLHNQHVLDDAVREGKAVVLLVTHSAGLDAGLLAVAPHYPLQGIYNPLDNPVFDWLVYRARHRFGAKPISRGSGLRQLIKGLNNGAIMCYLGDEDLGAEGAVFAPFFSNSKATLTMLPRIVGKTNAVVIPMIAHHDSDHDHVDVHFFDALSDYPSNDAVKDATTMNNAIANTVRLQPAQFTWKLRLFKTCPNGGGTRYGQIERGELNVQDL